MNRYRTVFMGTPEFSLPCLKALAEISDVTAVVTQPDRPKGRGHKLLPSPVKTFALAQKIDVLQPEKVSEPAFMQKIAALTPDLIVVVAFGQILPPQLLQLPRLGCVNIHASLLPRWRGAAPMQYAILSGDGETGITTMLMDKGLDTGDMLLSARIAISPTMNLGELHDRLKELGAKVLVDTVKQIETLPKIKQDDSRSTYAPLITKETGRIDWGQSARMICNLVRALDPAPGAYSYLERQKIKLWRAESVEADKKAPPGEIIAAGKEGLTVSAGEGAVLVKELQLPGGKRIAAADYLRGRKAALPPGFTTD